MTMTSAFAGSAAANPYNEVPNGVTSITLTKSSADMKRVAEYWNPAKLKQVMNNVPASPEMKSSSSTPSASPTPTGTSATATATATATAASTADTTLTTTATDSSTSSQLIKPTLPKKRPPASGIAPVTVGKVFFQIGGKDYWCSASSVAAANRNLVATAGHCAYDAKQGKHAEYWIFIPGYNKGATPYGIYVGHSLNLHESFVGKGDYDYDYAFVTVHDGFVWKPGKTASTYEMQNVGSLEDNVGGQGLAVNRGVRLYTRAFGYPAAPNIDGSSRSTASN
ncbi:trypsin-like serine peptidase [Streptosporangium lutulentum]